MKEWEYQTIQITYDRKQHKNWVLSQGSGQPPLIGLQAILGAFGAQGWELVNIGPDQFEVFPALGKYCVEPVVYRATFKRQAE